MTDDSRTDGHVGHHGAAVVNARFSTYMDLCLVCRACEDVCPSHVPFGRMMEGARTQVEPLRTRRQRFARWLGLDVVPTQNWGGFMMTLIIGVVGIIVSLPLGVLLALGRRSNLPLIHMMSVGFIEFVRGVPLITVLFMANVMIPLFLPQGVEFDILLRVLIGVILFSAAYVAEVVRGGLQAIPKGQYEGAMALGLGYWKMMGLIVLPQALKLVIPGIVNTFIGLFKDTTLVMIVSIFDFLGQMRAAFSDPNWSTPVTLFTGFAFAGLVYFFFCFGMSRYSLFVERRLNTGHRR